MFSNAVLGHHLDGWPFGDIFVIFRVPKIGPLIIFPNPLFLLTISVHKPPHFAPKSFSLNPVVLHMRKSPTILISILMMEAICTPETSATLSAYVRCRDPRDIKVLISVATVVLYLSPQGQGSFLDCVICLTEVLHKFTWKYRLLGHDALYSGRSPLTFHRRALSPCLGSKGIRSKDQ
jgi:hypothetical protein